jgi:hypothetical protein
MLGEARSCRMISGVGSAPIAITPRMAPLERMCRVSRRVSTPSMIGMPAASSQSPRLPLDCQLEGPGQLRTTTPRTCGIGDSMSDGFTP